MLDSDVDDIQSGALPIALAGIASALQSGGYTNGAGQITTAAITPALEGYGPLNNMREGVVYAADYGVGENESAATNTTGLQNAINASLEGSNPAYGIAQVQLPPGDIHINGDLNIPFCAGFEMRGYGRIVSTIIQDANDTPILNFDVAPYSHHIYVAQMGIRYNTQQLSSHPNSAAILLGGASNAQPSAITFDNIYFHQCFRGVYAYATGNSTPWGFQLTNCDYTSATGALFYAMQTAGKPNMRMDHLYISNTNTSAVATEGAIVANAMGEFVIHNLDIEQWNVQHIYLIGVETPVLIDGYHMENSTWSGSGVLYLNYIADGGFIARNVSVDGTVNKSSGDTYVFKGDYGVGALCEIDGMTCKATLTSGALYPLQLANGATGVVSGVRAGTFTDVPINPSHAASVSGLLRSDQYMPLPTKAGIPTDSDIPVAKDGAQVVDTTNNRLYVRCGGTWKYASLT